MNKAARKIGIKNIFRAQPCTESDVWVKPRDNPEEKAVTEARRKYLESLKGEHSKTLELAEEQVKHIGEIEELLESGNPGGEGSPPRDAPTAGTAAEPDKAGETAAPAAPEQTGETNNPGETGRFLSPCTKGRQEESVE